LKIRIDIGRDRSGEFFDIRCEEGVVPEVLDVQPPTRHLVLMIRDEAARNKFLLGRDERHWFAAAVPGDGVRDVRTAIESLRPTEIEGRKAIRQGEWFFVPASAWNRDPINEKFVLRNEPLRRGAGKPHFVDELFRDGGESVYVSTQYPNGLAPLQYQRLISRQPKLRSLQWVVQRRNPRVYARGKVRHADHKAIVLSGWHHVLMNTETQSIAMRHVAFID